jgi:hypothetical protein
MVLARRQKILIAVFFLGLVGLGVDRVFLRPQGGPQAASADSSDSYAVPLSPVRDARPAAVESPGPNVAKRLETIWPDREPNDAQARDPFSWAGSWLAGKGSGPASGPDPAEAFVKAHLLVAVVIDGRQSHVLIDDRVLKRGEQIDGFTLVSVGPKSAVFEHGGQRATLELPTR